MEGELLPWVTMAEALGWDTEAVVRTGKNTMKKARSWQRWPYEGPSPIIVTRAVLAQLVGGVA